MVQGTAGADRGTGVWEEEKEVSGRCRVMNMIRLETEGAVAGSGNEWGVLELIGRINSAGRRETGMRVPLSLFISLSIDVSLRFWDVSSRARTSSFRLRTWQ